MNCLIGFVVLWFVCEGAPQNEDAQCSNDVSGIAPQCRSHPYEDEVALLQLGALNSSQECATPMPAACSILYNVTPGCCSAYQTEPFNHSQFCSACQNSSNSHVLADVEHYCQDSQEPQAARSPVSFKDTLLSTFLFGNLTRTFRSILNDSQAPTKVCTNEEGDCSISGDPQYTALFKGLNQTPCCASLEPIVASFDMPNNATRSAFCAHCREAANHSASLAQLRETLC